MLRVLLCALLLIWPLSVTAQTDTDQPDGTIAIESDLQRDAAIAGRIRDILRQLDGYRDVSVAVADGIVTLRGTALEAAQIEALNGLVARVEGVVAIENNVTETTDLRERLSPAIARIQARTEQFVAYLPLLAIALGAGAFMFAFGLFVARRRWPWDRIAPNAFIADIYRQIVRLAFGVLAIVLTLDLLNATALLGTILGAAGIVGLAIGFAVRDTVENFISSIMLSIRQPFRPKDLVEIEGELGHVIRLTSRATILLSLDGNHIRIPNATVFKAKIVNYTRNDERRFDFTLGIQADADIARALDIVHHALDELPFLLRDPAPNVWVDGLGASSIDLFVIGWIAQHETSIVKAKGEAIRLVKARLEEAGITLPEPTYRLIGAGDAPMAPPPAPKLPAANPAPAEVREVGTEDTDALQELIESEREALPDEDLLRREAPQE